MPLMVHRAQRSDVLADALAELLATPLPDVFADEVIAVPAKGIERWLTQRLSLRLGRRAGRADGICAGVSFPSPGRLAAQVLGVVDDDPWEPDRLVWPLLEVIDECAGQDWLQLVGRHLGVRPDVAAAPEPAEGPTEDPRVGRRYAVARRLAGLFDGYAANRSSMLRCWRVGQDVAGSGGPLPPDLAWQAELWRRLRHRVAGPDPVQRLDDALRLLTDGSEPALPPRISLFGPTRLPQDQVRLLSALAERREVHLWLPHPSHRLWELLRPFTDDPGEGRMARATDPTLTLARHPLLASLGRDSRELQLILSTAPDQDSYHPGPAEPPATLLELLQQDLAQDRNPLPDRKIAPDDRSIQVHGCHGPVRQVDVLREVLVGLLAADPTLEPRDILVMCPDIEAYAPLIAAAFGLAEVVDDDVAHPGHQLRVRLADRALDATNPLLATVSRLLELAGGRVTASEVLDLASWPPVRRRFGFDDDDLEQLAAWTAASGARWGLDADHRKPFGLGGFNQNTWRSGLDRILLGVAMADEDANRLGLALPLDDVGSGDVELAGRFAEFVGRLRAALDSLEGPCSVRGWLDALSNGVESLVKVGPRESWQLTEMRSELETLSGDTDASGRITLRLADIRSMVLGRLAGRPTRSNFRTGTLTVCTMVPMRSVPHRVVCLLGLDDGAYPRQSRPDGDDILARDPLIGDRDARGEDRQLMLDAILAATGHLVITYSAADERTGAVRPPAVPLGELLDALDGTALSAAGGPVSDQVLVRHPLQPFDPRNLTPGALGVPGPFSHDRTALSAGLALTRPRSQPEPFLAEPLPRLPSGDLELADLIGWATHPVRGFLRQRLDIATRFDEDEPADSLPVELDQLQRWSIGDRLLAQRLAGMSEAECRQAEWRRGTLPPGGLGQRPLSEVLHDIAPLVERTGHLRSTPARTLDVAVTLPDGRQLRGTVPGVYGSTLVHVGYSKLGPKPQLQSWISLVALAASDPAEQWLAVVVGRGSSRPRRATLGPVQQGRAIEILGELADLYDRGMREPLPLPLKSSFGYAETAITGAEAQVALDSARMRWSSGTFPGEDADAAHLLVWGSRSFEQLIAIPAGEGERWHKERSRFVELSLRLWNPMLQHRQLEVL